MKRVNVYYDADDGANATTGTGAATPTTQEPNADAGTTPEPKGEQPKYTDMQLNDLVAKRAAKEAAKMLEEAGLKASGDMKKDVEAFNAWKASTMSETEKLKAELDAIKGADAESKKEAQAIKAENAALKKGVPADKVERVKKLVASGAYEGETVDAMVDAVLAEFPEYAKGAASIGGPVKNQSIDDDAAMMAKLEEMRNRK